LDLQLPVQSVPITTEDVSLNFIHEEVYAIQHYVNKETNHEYKMKNKALYYLPELDNGTDGECRHSDHL
jgi:hypothetical protein